jgi:hypothetical protein
MQFQNVVTFMLIYVSLNYQLQTGSEAYPAPYPMGGSDFTISHANHEAENPLKALPWQRL